MINKKLLEKAQKLWIDVDIKLLKEKWLPDDVIEDILEAEIDEKLGTSKYYTYEEVKEYFDKKFNFKILYSN